MKARTVIAPQIILSFGLNNRQTEQLNSIADKLKIIHKPVAHHKANQKVGFLCGFAGFKEITTPCENIPQEQCLVFSGIQRKNIDTLLKKLKSAELVIPLKAMVTPSNQSWTLSDLITELKKEHKLMTGKEN